MPKATAVVVGAYGGIGREIASYAHLNFDSTLLVGRSHDRLSRLKKELTAVNESGGGLSTEVADIRDHARMSSLLSASPAPDFVAICTGISPPGTLEIADRELQDALDTNLTGVISAVQATSKAMMSTTEGGLIVAMGSMSMRRQRPSLGGYAATQGGLFGYFRALRRELADTPVRLSLICPGFVRTDLAIAEVPSIHEERMIPISDIVEIVDLLVNLPKQVDVPEVFLDCKAQLNYPN